MKDNILAFVGSWKPISDRVVVLPEEKAKETDSGLITSDTKQAADKRVIGTVVAVGKGRYSENGELVPMDSKVGDRVIFGRFSGDDLLIDEGLHIEKYDGIRRDEQVLVTILRQDSLLTTL